jgi:hypothetical protein
MSDGSIALLAGLLSGGFGLLGVFVGYVLEKYSSKKTIVSEAVFHIYEQLMMITDNEMFWPKYPPIDEEALEKEMDKASIVISDIIDTLAKTKGFPYMYEVLEAVNAAYELMDIDEWETRYSSDYRFGIYRVRELLEKKIDNQDFIKAFDRAYETRSIKRMEKDGYSPERIEEYKQLRSKAKKELKEK